MNHAVFARWHGRRAAGFRIGFFMVSSVSLVSPLAPPSRHRWLVLGIVSVALLLIVIDMTVLYTALPRLTHDLAASASAKLWIINIYALVVSGLLLGMGTLGDKLGHKTLLMAATAAMCWYSCRNRWMPTTRIRKRPPSSATDWVSRAPLPN